MIMKDLEHEVLGGGGPLRLRGALQFSQESASVGEGGTLWGFQALNVWGVQHKTGAKTCSADRFPYIVQTLYSNLLRKHLQTSLH